MSNEDLRQEVLEHIKRKNMDVVWTDLENVVGGRCPWKRLGELEAEGLLEVKGTAPGRYGRTVKVYGLPEEN